VPHTTPPSLLPRHHHVRIGIVQFVAYNLALILVFVVNYLLFRKT
jgi:hypothetical protein